MRRRRRRNPRWLASSEPAAQALPGAVAAAVAIAALAGLYPAVRAARMSPAEALRTI